MRSSKTKVTDLLVAWNNGDRGALHKLMPLVYRDLRRVANRRLMGERPGHSMQATALIHETYLRLTDQKDVNWQNRAHFYAIAARLMRRILVDHARRRRYAKRGGSGVRVSIARAEMVSGERAAEVLALDDALQSLARVDSRKSQVVELRFFGGLSVEETAQVLSISPNTVIRDWSTAKAWLHREMTKM
jgi:RNA polymerase sigma factor (TIGR02999 family)